MNHEFQPSWPRSERDRRTFLNGEKLSGKRLGFFLDGLPEGVNEFIAPFEQELFGPRGRRLVVPNVVEFGGNAVTFADKHDLPRKTFTLVKEAFSLGGFPVVLFDAEHANPREGILLARPSTKRLTGKPEFD